MRHPYQRGFPKKIKKVVYYESIKRKVKIKCIYECRCYERLQTKTKEFTRLAYTGLFMLSQIVYYESLKRELKTKTMYGLRCDERLKTKFEESTRLSCTLLCAELEHLKIETRLTSETPVSEMGECLI